MGIRLLTDIRTVFGARDVMRTKDLLNALIDMEESVWADLRGNPMTDRGLARRLQPYDIVSKTSRDGNWIGRGYAREDFYDFLGEVSTSAHAPRCNRYIRYIRYKRGI
jgi:hypothetical protein